MAPLGLKGATRDARPRRHTVRIVKPRIPSRTAALSLAAVAVTAVFSFAAWRWWRSDAIVVIESVPPALFEVELDWRCPAGHSFAAPGQIGSRQCPRCGAAAFPYATYSCQKHGEFEVQVEFARGADGGTRISRLKVAGGEWKDAGSGPQCPRCGQIMVRNKDPLSGLIRNKRKGGG